MLYYIINQFSCALLADTRESIKLYAKIKTELSKEPEKPFAESDALNLVRTWNSSESRSSFAIPLC